MNLIARGTEPVSYTHLKEQENKNRKGISLVPLIMERMINPCDFYFLVLYEAVMEGNETNDDSMFSESEQIRACLLYTSYKCLTI